MFLGWILIGLVIYWIWKNKGTTFNNGVTAEKRLKERFVNGEIDEETYLKMKSTLEK